MHGAVVCCALADLCCDFRFFRVAKMPVNIHELRSEEELPPSSFPKLDEPGIKFDALFTILIIYALFTFVVLFLPRRQMSRVYEAILKLGE